MWLVFDQIEFYAGDNIIKTIAYLMEANFVGSYNILDIFSGPFNIIELLNPQFLSWIFIGYISGSIARGKKRGFLTSLIVVVIVVLIWVSFNIISGTDLMAMFQGQQLLDTLGGIIAALISCLLGGVLGGLVSGPYEDF